MASLTPFNKAALPISLDELKTLIEERHVFIKEQATIRAECFMATETAMEMASEELKMLQAKAAAILGIPTTFEVKEGKVERSRAPVDNEAVDQSQPKGAK